ncbi:MAG: hypothetical protein MGG11_18310 [Trichodesmium sp. MAG_R03]|nr:hypothetical protein [Trichodesmium sp. MAG_R03]
MKPLFPIIPIHEGSWFGDDSVNHADDQHHDSDSLDHANDHSLDSNISVANSVGHIDHNYYSPNWSSEYDNQSAHSFSDDGWVNKILTLVLLGVVLLIRQGQIMKQIPT